MWVSPTCNCKYSLTSGPFRIENVSTFVRESKTVLDSGFHAVDSGFQLLHGSQFFVGGTWIWIPIVNGISDSLSCILDSNAQNPDSTSKNFPDYGIRIRLHIAKRYQHRSINLLWTSTWNRTLPSSKNPHFQNEARCTTFLVKMSFICMRMKNDFHIKGWAPTLVLKQRPGGTRKWPIAVQNWVHPIWCYFPFYVGWQCKSICGGKVDTFWLFRRSCLGWRRKGTFYVTQCI